jgi:hypothetical protein
MTNEIHTQFKSLKSLCPNLNKGKHVRSHHEKSPGKTPVTWQEHLNSKAYSLAKQSTSPAHDPQMLPHCKAFIRSGDNIISSNEIFISRWKWGKFELQQYFRDKFFLSETQLYTIN